MFHLESFRSSSSRKSMKLHLANGKCGCSGTSILRYFVLGALLYFIRFFELFEQPLKGAYPDRQLSLAIDSPTIE